MVVDFIFYDVVRCWCLFPGTALWEWVLNSGLVMLFVLLDAAMMWLASGWLGVALARFAQLIALLFMFVGLLAVFNVSKRGSDAAFSACLLHAASGGLARCGLCPFMAGETLLWLAPAGIFQLSLLRELFASGLWICFSVQLIGMCVSCKVVQATALLVAVSENGSVPVVLESSFGQDASLAGSGTVSSSGLCSRKGFSLKKGKVLVDRAQFVLIPSQAALGTNAELDVDEGDFKITDCEWENGPAIVGCPFVGIGEQATGRVDVPDDGFVSAAASAAASMELDISFFVRSLPGRNIIMKFGKSRTVQELCAAIAFRTGVLERHFYLLLSGRMLASSSSFESAGIETDSQIVMCGRLNGGGRTVIEGEWDCQKCGMQGCWPTRHKCFRCGHPRFAGGRIKFPERERNALGRPVVVPPRVNPTHRKPPRQAPQAAPVTPVVIEEGGLLGCDTQLLFEFLRQMGLSEEVMKQVQSKVQPRSKEVSKEKALHQARARLDQVVAQKAKLERTLKFHMDKVRETEDALSEKVREVTQATEHYKEMNKLRFSPTPSVVPEDARSAEHVSADDMSQCGDQGDVDSVGGNEPNVSQVSQNVGSSKRRDVVPGSDGTIPCGLPAVDVLAQGLVGYSHTDLNRLKEALEERLNVEATASLFREEEEQDRILGSKGSQG